MIDELTMRGVRRVYLEVEAGNDAARALYERSGFMRSSALVDYYGPGKDGVQMVCELTTHAASQRAAG
jgi:ribosomal protein S18 acetylase RimI-like enzyme